MLTKFRVEISHSAERDAEEIWNFIFADSPTRAAEFILELELQITSLERFPSSCPLIPENEILGSQYRHLIFGNYRTVFRISGKTVFVLRILHGARLLDASMFEIQK